MVRGVMRIAVLPGSSSGSASAITARTLPTDPCRADVAVGRPSAGAHMPAVGGMQFAGGLQVLGDQRRVLIGRRRVTLLGSRLQDAGAIRRDRISAVTRRQPRGSADGETHTGVGREAAPDRSARLSISSSNERLDTEAVNSSVSNREPITAAAVNIRLACGSRRSMRALDCGLQRGWHADLGHVCLTYISAALPAQHAALGEIAHDFLGEERVTADPVGDNCRRARRPTGPGRAARRATRRCPNHPVGQALSSARRAPASALLHTQDDK